MMGKVAGWHFIHLYWQDAAVEASQKLQIKCQIIHLVLKG